MRVELAQGATYTHPLVNVPVVDDEIEIIAQYGTTIQITGCDGAELERDGRALAAAKSKTLAASGKPVVIKNPGKGLRVTVE